MPPVRSMEADLTNSNEESPEVRGSEEELFDLTSAVRRDQDEVDLFSSKKCKSKEKFDTLLGLV